MINGLEEGSTKRSL